MYCAVSKQAQAMCLKLSVWFFSLLVELCPSDMSDAAVACLLPAATLSPPVAPLGSRPLRVIFLNRNCGAD